jgi:hypothetical protein
MMNQVFLYAASAMLVLGGMAHLVPTGSVVKGFGDISEDNRRIIAMEWITGGAALIFMGLLVAGATREFPASAVSRMVYHLTFFMLNALSLISLFTGFRVNFLPFKLCPVIFTVSSFLILLGAHLR